MLRFVEWIERCGLLCARGGGRFCGLLLLSAITIFKIVMVMHISGVRMKANVEVCVID